MHRALVLAVLASCVTRHYVVDPHTMGGQDAVVCMDKCSPDLFGECPERCHVDAREDCGPLAPGLECKSTHHLHWSLQALIYAGMTVFGIGGAISFLYAE